MTSRAHKYVKVHNTASNVAPTVDRRLTNVEDVGQAPVKRWSISCYLDNLGAGKIKPSIIHEMLSLPGAIIVAKLSLYTWEHHTTHIAWRFDHFLIHIFAHISFCLKYKIKQVRNIII